MLAVWLLTMVVIVNAYTGVLTSLLSVPKFEPTVVTLDQAVAGGKCCVTMERNSVFMDDYLVNILGQFIKNNILMN